MKSRNTKNRALVGMMSAGVALALTAGAAEAPGIDNAAVRERIESLEREVETLKRLLQSATSAPRPATAAPAAAPGASSAAVDALNEKVRVLEEKQEKAEARAKTAPVVTVGERGFSLQSADGNYLLRLRGLVQADGRFYVDDGDLNENDTFLVRRARIELAGTVFEKFDFRIMPDFAGSSATLVDAWVDWKIDPKFQLIAGKVKLPVGLERLQSAEARFLNELGYVTALVPNRDVGIAAHGELVDGLEYYVGGFNGASDGGSSVTDSDDEKTLVGRLFWQPFSKQEGALKGLGIGLAATWGDDEGSLSNFRTVGQQTFFRWSNGSTSDGTVWRVVPQLSYFNGPFGLLGEYAVTSREIRNAADRATVANEAWQVEAVWVLTGEDATFRGVKPKKPVTFGEDRGWGAWQLAARVTQLDIDDDAFPVFANPDQSPSRALSLGGGINWYLNSMVRVSADYNWTDFKGAGIDDEHAVITRLQLRF